MDEILKRLVKARESAGLTQGQVAAMLGVSRTTITTWEDVVRSNVTVKQILSLCEIYGVSVGWVMTGVNESWDAEAFMRTANIAATEARQIIEVLEMLSMSQRKP